MTTSLASFRPRPLRTVVATMAVAIAAAFAFDAADAAPPGGPGGPGMMMFGGGPHMDHVLDAVNATPEQRAQIKSIFDAARADLKSQRDAGRTVREQMAQLFTQPTVDARAAEALRQQQMAQHDATSKRMLQAMLDASRVLSAEQRKTLAQKMADRRALMERHRSEREALDGSTRR